MRLDLPVLPNLALGYYELNVITRGAKVDVKGGLRVVVTPPHCYVPEAFDRGVKIWGLALQLYSLRSLSNWGAGVADLGKLVEWAGRRLGAGIVGLNPPPCAEELSAAPPQPLCPQQPTLSQRTLYRSRAVA
ncbi:MAG: hypothetical protein U0361_18980 [Nitrospiraceae bacterium]